MCRTVKKTDEKTSLSFSIHYRAWYLPSILFFWPTGGFRLCRSKQCVRDTFSHDPNRVIFNWVSKVIPDCLDFALLRYVIGSETRAFLSTNQIENKKAIVTWPLAFSRASDNSVSFTLRPHWLLVIFSCPLIGWCDYFGFGFATFNQMHCNGLH